MKNLLNLGVNNPLALGMGHPIQSRLEQLQHVKKGGRIIPATIGLTLLMTSAVSSVSAKTDDLVREVAAPVIDAVQKTAQITTQTPVQTAEFTPKVMPSVTNRVSAETDLKPMRLRMSPRFTNEQLETVQALRQSRAQSEPGADKAIRDGFINMTYFNRYEARINDTGQGTLFISKGSGGWPGFKSPESNWVQRPMSRDMRRGLKSIIDTCAKSSGPVYFRDVTVEGDADVGRGNYQIECTPGNATVRANTSSIDLANAWLTSGDIPLSDRQAGIAWRMGFALMDEYVASNVEHSIAADRAACIRIQTKIRDSYRYDDAGREGSNRLLEKCPTGDYNWVRRRLNIPEI